MKTQIIKISNLKNNTGQIQGLPKNPRILKDDKFIKLKKSLQDDPEMLKLREVIAYDNNGELVVICGNMRLRALIELGIKEVPTKILPKETPVDKLKAYTIKDNVAFGEHSWEDLANEWDTEEISEWGLDIPNWSTGHDVNSMTDDDVNSMLGEEFDPIGLGKDLSKVVFIFDNQEQAKQFIETNHPSLEYKLFNGGSSGRIFQINLSSVYGE